jgi:glycosyltransferase involved in cell wall biosynthesis
MKLRLAWIADPEDADTYSAKETRVLLRALARRDDIIALWFALGSTEPPHFWNGVRVFPIPEGCLGSADFLKTLIAQQRPHVVFWNLPRRKFAVGLGHLASNGVTCIHRPGPDESEAAATPQGDGAGVGTQASLPLLSGLDPGTRGGEEPSRLLDGLLRLVAEVACPRVPTGSAPSHLVMRQQLFCNSSLAHVMFELTNALIELGVPAVPQDEHASLAMAYIHREEDLFRAGAPEKYDRVLKCLSRQYDPEASITVHFSMLQHGGAFSRFGVFNRLTPREVLYTTGNHLARPDGVRRLQDLFEKVLAPSRHVLRPYLEAGLDPRQGAVIPHGVDPEVFRHEAAPLRFPTEKKFKFMQTSFPWLYEKGFDLTIEAYCRAFTARDDVSLILRVPSVRDAERRAETFGRLDALVREAREQPCAPEMLLIEQDVPLNQRGGIYTAADCYVFPLRAEGFSITILEAMACGLPVIATPWSGPADFLSPRWAYTLSHSRPVPERTRKGTLLRYHVEPDMDHLVHLMRHVHRNRDEAKALGSTASELARHHWTWRHAAEKLAATFGLRPACSGPAARRDPLETAGNGQPSHVL